MTDGEKMVWAAVFYGELSKMRTARGIMPKDHIAAIGSASYAVRELRNSVEHTEDMHGMGGSDAVKMLKEMLAEDGALPSVEDSTAEWTKWYKTLRVEEVQMLRSILRMNDGA